LGRGVQQDAVGQKNAAFPGGGIERGRQNDGNIGTGVGGNARQGGGAAQLNLIAGGQIQITVRGVVEGVSTVQVAEHTLRVADFLENDVLFRIDVPATGDSAVLAGGDAGKTQSQRGGVGRAGIAADGGVINQRIAVGIGFIAGVFQMKNGILQFFVFDFSSQRSILSLSRPNHDLAL